MMLLKSSILSLIFMGCATMTPTPRTSVPVPVKPEIIFHYDGSKIWLTGEDVDLLIEWVLQVDAYIEATR